MMTPAPMCRVTLSLLTDELAQAGLVLARFGSFAPQVEEKKPRELQDSPLANYLDLYEKTRIHYFKITQFLDLHPQPEEPPRRVPTLEELQSLNRWLKELWDHCSGCAETWRRTEDALREVQQLQELLKNYRHLDLDLGLLQSDFRFLHIRLGTIPHLNVGRLREAVALAGFTLTPIATREERSHIIVAGLKEKAAQLDTVLKAADFRGLQLPAEFSGTPDQVEQDLIERRQRILQERRHLECEVRDKRQEYRERLEQAALQLLGATGFAQFGDAPASRGGLSRVSGWVPRSELSRLKSDLRQQLAHPVMIESHIPAGKENRQVPSCVRHGRWLQPFAGLVRNYGVPRYAEVDPTILLAVTFSLMFGMMFGDIGHGAVIAVTGLLLGKRFPLLRSPLVLAGISSLVFGFLYGSLFGYEHVIPALWISPLEDPELMLQVAFGWGAFFIVMATLLKIRNDLVEGEWGVALFDSRGVAGLLLYVCLLLIGWYWLKEGSLPTFLVVMLGTALASILAWKWWDQQAPFGEKLLVVFVEGFETFMNYISSTLSFLRVAAFGLNHVALAMAVFALAEMFDTTGHWITVILGNLFILIAEGAIVVIQVLRLEYYEGFSRFFRGDGRPFKPLKLSLETDS